MKYIITILFLVTISLAQTTLPGWNVTINGNFTNITGANTNNGFLTSEAVRVANNWSLRADQYITAIPVGGVVVLGKVEYRRLLSDFINPNNYFNTTIVEPFFNVGAGDAKSSFNGVTSPAKFAYSIGAGFDILPTNSSMFTVRPLDISYVRASMLNNGGQFIGNHMTLAAGLGLRFGSASTINQNKAMKQQLRAKYNMKNE